MISKAENEAHTERFFFCFCLFVFFVKLLLFVIIVEILKKRKINIPLKRESILITKFPKRANI